MKMVLRIRRINPAFILFFIILNFSGCETFKKGGVYSGLDGAWSCQENSAYSGYRKYIVEIDKVQSQDNVYIISNFHNLGNIDFLYASFQGDSLLIENQVISGIFINGKGFVNSEFNDIEIVYTTDDGSIELQYFANLSR